MEDHTYREEIDTNLKRPTPISWGAILAGVFAMLGVSWMMYLLGLAIGVTAMDLSDTTFIGDGLSQAAIFWMILTALASYFIGASLAARLSGTADDSEGMMIGFSLWGAATTASVLLAYCGVSSMMQMGGSLVTAAASATGSAAQAATSAAGSTVAGATGAFAALEGTDTAATIRSRLKRQLATTVADLDVEGGEDVTAEEVRESIDDLDAAALDDLTKQLIDDDRESAAELIASETELSQADANELIDGVYEALEERYGDPDNDTGLAGDLRSQAIDRVAEAIVAFDAKGGANVSKQSVKDALQDLDSESLSAVAKALYNGRTEKAKDLLVENTDLEEEEINELVKGASNAYRSRADAVVEAADETTEAVSTYAAELLWAAFATTGLGLAAAVLGGWCGADTSRRLYYEVREVHKD
ncbi:hypothetical protein Pla108_11970 [Botrimarina colliarenosi]|uniref:Uncharacterized protein n=1 Tax=Botrimarina colliarenosi TaxID=2528001 RepID=A0A5C6AKR7_9BACT|nr:hypothetical protein [Botrimarina colliarenosi]TWU00250.1 hypothetical protein Pla108_11970 [Botrimarina colliarenosi]